MNKKVKIFRFLTINDLYDVKYKEWSRIYEYPIILKYIIDLKGNNNNVKIHNTSWGFNDVHFLFRSELDKIGDCLHTDIVNSDLADTIYYDITKENSDYVEKFDFVLNVSTIEHLKSPELVIKSLNNLFSQVKVNGFFIMTFDYPDIDLNMIENWVGEKCVKNGVLLNGENSVMSRVYYKHLNIVLLIIQKI